MMSVVGGCSSKKQLQWAVHLQSPGVGFNSKGPGGCRMLLERAIGCVDRAEMGAV